MKTTLIVFVIMTGLSRAFGQSFNAFIDDTMFVERLESYHYVLKDSLPDGMWYLHNLKRIDSAKADQTTLIMSVEYKNQLKQGPLLRFCYDEKQKELLVLKRKEYVDGKKNGFFLVPGIRGYFKDDLPHGLWVKQYNQSFWVCGRKNKQFRSRSARLLRIRSPNFFTCRFHRRIHRRQVVDLVVSYDNGIVQQWHAISRLDGRIYETGVGSLSVGECHVVIYRKSGTFFQEYFFEDGNLTRFLEYYESGNISKLFIYDKLTISKPDQSCLQVVISNQFSFWLGNPTPCDGFIIEYDEFGNEISRTEYRDGQRL